MLLLENATFNIRLGNGRKRSINVRCKIYNLIKIRKKRCKILMQVFQKPVFSTFFYYQNVQVNKEYYLENVIKVNLIKTFKKKI